MSEVVRAHFPTGCSLFVCLLSFVSQQGTEAAQNRVITDFKSPSSQFSYMAWEDRAEASDGELSIRAEGSRGGYGLNQSFDLSGLDDHSPAIVLTRRSADQSTAVNLMFRDEKGVTSTFHFSLGDAAFGKVLTLTPEDAASFALPNRPDKERRDIDWAKIKQIQVLGEWKGNKPIDVQIDRVLAIAPNESLLAARENLKARLKERQEKEAKKRLLEQQKLLEEQRRVAEARENVHHDEDCAAVVHVGAVDRDILAIEIRDGVFHPCRLEPYVARQGDEIVEKRNRKTGEVGSTILKRDGVEVAEFVTKNCSHIRYPNDVAGEPLVWATLRKPDAYTIASTDDDAYSQPTSPLRVSHKCKPTAAWVRGPRQATRHYVYLHLPSPLKPGAEYTVRFVYVSTQQAGISFKHEPKQTRSEAIHVNHVGFRPNDPSKRAYLSVWLGDGGAHSYSSGTTFQVVNAETGTSVYAGKAELSFTADDVEKLKHEENYNLTDVYTLDFPSVQQPGLYRVVVDGVGCSYPFLIDEQAWSKAYVAAMRGFYQHRTGIEIGPPHFQFKRPRNFREEDGVRFWELTDEPQSGDAAEVGTHLGIGYRTGRQLRGIWGGYHDAGDWDMHSGHLLASMGHMELMELCPDFFADAAHNTPESGNRIPDCLEEALFNVRLFKRMQKKDGSVRHGVEFDKQQSNGTTKGPSWLVTDLVVYDSNPLSTLKFAASAAKMSHLLGSFDADEARELREASLRAMAYAEANHEAWTGRRVRDGELKKDEDAIRAWRAIASLELYRLTGEPRWHELFKKTTLLTDEQAVRNALDFMYEKHGFSAALYARMDGEQVDPELQERARSVLIQLAEMTTENGRGNAFNAAHPTASMPPILGFWSAPFVVECVWAHHLTGDERYLATIINAQNFALGANPMNMSMTSGLGHVSATPLHRDTECTGQEMFEGIAPYGPHDWKYWGRGNNWATFGFIWHFSKECHPTGWVWPVTESYFDVRGFPAMTEHCVPQTMMRNSFIWGYLAGRD